MIKIAYRRTKTLKFNTMKGLVKLANRQTGKPKSGQHLPQSLYMNPRSENGPFGPIVRVGGSVRGVGACSRRLGATGRDVPTRLPRERFLIELMPPDRKLEASIEGSKSRIYGT